MFNCCTGIRPLIVEEQKMAETVLVDLIIPEIHWHWVVPAYLPLEIFIFRNGSGMVSWLAKRVRYQPLQRETVDCVPHTKVFFAWNSDVSYMPLPWPFSFQYVSHRRGGCFEANQNATPQKTSRALPALLLEQGLRAT